MPQRAARLARLAFLPLAGAAAIVQQRQRLRAVSNSNGMPWASTYRPEDQPPQRRPLPAPIFRPREEQKNGALLPVRGAGPHSVGSV